MAVVDATIVVSVRLRCWTTGLGASLGMYSPARNTALLLSSLLIRSTCDVFIVVSIS